MNDEELFQRTQNSSLLVGPTSRPVLRIGGGDAERYLHGRITQNVKALRRGDGARSLLLTPQGRIQGHFVVLKEENHFLLISDPVLDRETLVSALLQFKVADDVVLEDLSDEYHSFVLLGPDSTLVIPELSALSPGPYTHTQLEKFDAHVYRESYGSVIAYTLLVPRERSPQIVEALAAAPASESFLEMLRVSVGRPRMERDLSEKVLAPEIELADLVSFNKGCYTGQEVVEMATARGRPNRFLTRLEARSAYAPKAEAEVFSSTDLEKPCGTLSSVCTLPSEKVCALAFLKTVVAEQTQFISEGVQFQRVN